MKPRATSANRTRRAAGTKAASKCALGHKLTSSVPLQPNPLQPWKRAIPTFVVHVSLLDDLFSAVVEPRAARFP